MMFEVRDAWNFQLWTRSLDITKRIYDMTTKERFQKVNLLRRHSRKTVILLNVTLMEAFERKNFQRTELFWKKTILLCDKIKKSLNCALFLGYVEDEEVAEVLEDLEWMTCEINHFLEAQGAAKRNMGYYFEKYERPVYQYV
jgi:hypothetical protein